MTDKKIIEILNKELESLVKDEDIKDFELSVDVKHNERIFYTIKDLKKRNKIISFTDSIHRTLDEYMQRRIIENTVYQFLKEIGYIEAYNESPLEDL